MSNPLLCVKLNCGHFTRMKRSRIEGVNPCPRCQNFTTVVGFWSREWRVFCHICTWGKWFGQDRESALREAAAHHRPTHPTTVVYDDLQSPTPIDRQIAEDQDTLFEYPGAEAPPF